LSGGHAAGRHRREAVPVPKFPMAPQMELAVSVVGEIYGDIVCAHEILPLDRLFWEKFPLRHTNDLLLALTFRYNRGCQPLFQSY
jgi:hypothetical protein